MSHTFCQVDRDTLFQLPPSMEDWLPEGHLARFIVEIVEQLDLTAIKAAYAGRGSKAHHPEMGLLKLGKVSLDGTKIKANASKHRALSWKHACKLEAQLKAEVEDLLRQAEEADRSELPDGLDIPDERARREERLAAIAKAKTEIEQRAAQRYAEEQADYEKKLAERQAKEQKSGKKTPWQATQATRVRPPGYGPGQPHG